MSRTRASVVVFAVALLARLAIAAWAFNGVGPVADGTYYHTLAARLAAGQGYTWAWPDGHVTYAAHYPVGYPALVAAVYRVMGPYAGYAMVLNAWIGACGALLLHRAALRVTSPRAALMAALVVALHPALVSYTPALMTEGVTAALLAAALWAALWAADAGARPGLAIATLGVVIGFATLVRPQSLVLAPLFGLAATAGLRPHVRAGWTLVSLLVSLAVVAPWTARNCDKMGRCALVSVNGGWNLLIGADAEAGGNWAPIKVPEACVSVYDEAEKDVCFERAALRAIAADPVTWIAIVPKKLGRTFDYCGAGAWYLRESDPGRFPQSAKIAVGALETLVQRLLLAAALVVAASAHGGRFRRRNVVRGFVSLCAALAFLPWAWPGVLAFCALALGSPATLEARRRRVLALAAALIGSTAAIHAVFFGAGRYGLVIIPALALVAAQLRWPFDTAPQNADD